MGINTTDVNQASINSLDALQGRPFTGTVQAERFCRPVEDDVVLLRDAGYFQLIRPSDYNNFTRQPQFGKCGQEDACS